jgi:hypothetical protein
VGIFLKMTSKDDLDHDEWTGPELGLDLSQEGLEDIPDTLGGQTLEGPVVVDASQVTTDASQNPVAGIAEVALGDAEQLLDKPIKPKRNCLSFANGGF